MLLGIIIRLIRGGARSSNRRTPLVLFVLGGMLGVVSLIAFTSPDGAPTCDGKEMSEGDGCRKSDGRIHTYDEELAEDHGDRIFVGGMAGAFAVGLGGLGLYRRKAINDARALLARQRAMAAAGASAPPPAPPSYDWSPESLYTGAPWPSSNPGPPPSGS